MPPKKATASKCESSPPKKVPTNAAKPP
ncbi:unnamed protein product, partial [Rotaria magnacalcarata]